MRAGTATIATGRGADHERMLVIGAIATGAAALVLRLAVIGRPSASVVFVAIYVALAALALSVPVPKGADRALAVPIVAGIGIAAVAFATAAMPGPRFVVAHGPEVVALNSLAAVAEEAFFRRLVYGGFMRLGVAPAVLGSALLFALVHVPLYGMAAFWVDLGAGLLLSWQRWASGGWAASAITHVTANLLAVL